MRRITTAISIMLLTLVTASVQGQSLNPAPPPELKKWNIWIGNWALSGTAKDTPTGPEYKKPSISSAAFAMGFHFDGIRVNQDLGPKLASNYRDFRGSGCVTKDVSASHF